MLHSGVPWPVDDGKLSRFPYIFPSPSRSEPRCVARELEQQETPDARGQIWTRFDSYGLHMKIHLAISQDHLYSGHQGLFCRAGGRQRSTPDVASERALHWTRRCSLNPAGHALSLAVHRTSFPFRRGRRVYPASQLCQIDSFLKRRTADKKQPSLSPSVAAAFPSTQVAAVSNWSLEVTPHVQSGQSSADPANSITIHQ